VVSARWAYDSEIITGYPIVTRRLLSAALGLLPVGVAAAWIPLRATVSSADIALILVLMVAAVSMVGGRVAALIGSVAATLSFDFFDAPPYGRLAITRAADVATAVALLAVGLLVGELIVRLFAYRATASRLGGDFAVMSGAAGLMAVGERAPLIVGALTGELIASLGLADCQFEAGTPGGERPCVARDGSLVHVALADASAPVREIDLPVWAGGEVIGRFRMVLEPGPPPTRNRLLAAVGIADQAGAALMTSGAEPRPGPPKRRLRLVH
jgi:hypothetical protein